MTFEQMKNKSAKISTQHAGIQHFGYGEEFVINDLNQGRINYAFLGIPDSISYDETDRVKIIQVAVIVLFPATGTDGVVEDHIAN